MLKRNIKIILVGLFSLLFLGLVYGLFGAKPEIISDDSLRIEEPVIPGLDAQVKRAMEASTPQSIPVSDAQQSIPVGDTPLGGSFDKDLTSQSLSGSQEIAVSDEAQTAQQPVQAGIVDVAVDKPKVPRADISSSVNPFKSDPMAQPVQPVADNEAVEGKGDFLVLDRSEDPGVANASEPLVPNASDFIDLNLDEVEPSIPNTVLQDGEQFIVDDINEGFSKLNADSSDEKDEASKDLTLAEEVASDKDAPVAEVFPFEPSAFVMPKIDPELMQGNSEISKQYRETMNKIISINAKLRDADAENADLQVQFEMAVDQNRQLAQIIRDIDTQIKALTVTN